MGPQGGGFLMSKYMRDILKARNAASDKRYEAEQAQEAKAAVDADTAREMGRAAGELAERPIVAANDPRYLPGADNPFWAKPPEYRAKPRQSPGYYEVPHSVGAVGGPVKEHVQPKRSYEEQLVYDMKGAAADPNVQERAEADATLANMSQGRGLAALRDAPAQIDPDASPRPWWRGKGIR